VETKIKEALLRHFGFDAFRSGQEAVVRSILAHRDVLVLMPTGGGKSLCFQLPALLMEGTALVVSPLISLMKDQVDGLLERSLAATFINSSLSPSEQGRRLAAIDRGEYKLVYVAPERFRDRRFVAALSGGKISFVAVDEAHCVSFWGHDFRPDYLRVGQFVEHLGRPPIAAFTATATPDVRADVQDALKMDGADLFVSGFERPNLEFRVSHCGGKADKLAALGALLEAHRTGIVYCATRKRVEEVSAALHKWEITHIAYHGGMDDAARKIAQEAFMGGRADVAVATNAFGMGIDRADVRFIAHFEMTGSVEAYYQEAGRAGRDGLPAVCELLFNHQDRMVQEFFIEGNNPDRALVQEVFMTLRRLADDDGIVRVSLQDLAVQCSGRVNPMAVSTAVNLLARAGVVERFDIPGERVRGTRMGCTDFPFEEPAFSPDALFEKKRRDLARLQSVIAYANAADCRQAWILRYFGEAEPVPCLRCDSCQSRSPENLRPGSAEEVDILRKALSGVARMSTRTGPGQWRPRFGKSRVIDVLLGSRRAEVRERQLDRLSTHGILKETGSAYLKALFVEIERSGLIGRSDGEYPLVVLTASGEAVMKNEMSATLAWPELRTRSRAGGDTENLAATTEFDKTLFEALRTCRRNLSNEGGNLPAYTIFNDRTLKEMAAKLPLNAEDAVKISGIGAVKVRRWFHHFVPLIAAHVANPGAPDGTAEPPRDEALFT
jgi:ATP-dependent DNA helicase RecQ